MNRKALIWIGMSIGSLVGAYVPLLWGADALSFSPLFFGAVGGILGIWLGFKSGDWLS